MFLIPLLALSGCASRVAWEVRPAPAVELDSTVVAIATDDRACKPVADSLVRTLSARPGMDVQPRAETRLVVESCEQFVSTTVEIQQDAAQASTLHTDRRKTTVSGTGVAVVGVYEGEERVAEIEVSVDLSDSVGWTEFDADPSSPEVSEMSRGVDRELAAQIADEIAPLPQDLKRRLYKDAEPGTARALHNDAVAAEQSGDLDQALMLAEEAYAAHPTAANMRYIEQLEHHAETVGYVFATEGE
ncbi:MAG: hypothetical protein VX899_02400 [Myxococcota bacterium]|nr:hypothetical protein [Myxococcota bacterium]